MCFFILLSHSLLAIPDLPVFLLLVLEEQLVTSHHEMEEARLWEVLLMEDRKHAVVAGVR
jgi:hypothetical protein